MRRVRIVLGLIILIVSIILLVWGFMPTRHEVRSQPISPTDLQLPTPASFLPQQTSVAWPSCESATAL